MARKRQRRDVKLAKMIAKWTAAGPRMKPEQKLEWRRARLKWALERDGLSYSPELDEILVDQMVKESHRADAARYRRAYGSSR